MPKFRHRDFQFEVDDAWWADAGMIGFVPKDCSFRPGPPESGLGLDGCAVLLVPVDKVAPLRRNLSHGVFNDGLVPAKDRVVKILVGFLRGDLIPPVQLVRLPDDTGYSHYISNGTHRFYCAVAAGFSHVPAVEVVDYLEENPLDATPT